MAGLEPAIPIRGRAFQIGIAGPSPAMTRKERRGNMGSVNPSIDLRHEGEVAVVTIDNPPVNALKHEVRAGLIEAFQRVKNDAGVKAAVLACAGRTFSA